jgi:hypothetical protein
MARAVVLLALTLALSSELQAEEPVFFADATLKTAVEAELWILDPTPTDMLGLISLYVSVTDQPIGSLTGLEYAGNLEELSVPCNYITDISVLSGLSNLRILVLNNNGISEMSALSNLTNLEHVDVHDNFVSDISALSGLSNLQTLILRGNRISDISVLSGLSHLKEVNLYGNQISDISWLAGLTGLESLDIRGNPLGIEACSVHIPQIIAGNPEATILPSTCLFGLSLSAGIGGSITTPGEGDFAYAYGQWFTLEAKADPCFVFAGWSGTYFTSRNPVLMTIDQNTELRADFVSMLDTIHVDNAASSDPDPGDPCTIAPYETGTVNRPFDRIQEAIDVAANGATIIVRPGTYHETIRLPGKSIRLLGINRNDSNGTTWPVIDGAGASPVVSFAGGGDPNCTLQGFVITGGKGTSTGAIQCSGGSSPTIANCLIAGNRGTGLNSAVVHCTDSNPVLINCTIADNCAGSSGAALYLKNSPVRVLNSILWGDTPAAIVSNGARMPSVRYSCIAGGWPGLGNIVGDPLFARAGYWVDGSSPSVAVTPDHPDATWVMGDYHLQSQAGRWDASLGQWVQDAATSPCVDAGDPASPVGDEPFPDGGVINMGVYGGTAEAAR